MIGTSFSSISKSISFEIYGDSPPAFICKYEDIAYILVCPIDIAFKIEKYLDKSLTSSCNKNFGSEYK